MLAVEIRFLTGRYAAARHTDPSQPEWPPHPARLYSALTAALHDGSNPEPDERRALEWLAEAGAPEIVAPRAAPRHQAEVFVPTNDPKALDSIDTHLLKFADARSGLREAEGKDRAKAERSLEKIARKLRERSEATSSIEARGTPANAVEVIEQRPRHPRHFAVAVPEAEVVQMRWELDPPTGVTVALDRLCGRVGRLGHSSSLVAVRAIESPDDLAGHECWVPEPGGEVFLRVPLPGQLALLEEAHTLHQQLESRILPADPTPYRTTDPREARPAPPARGVFADDEAEWILYEVVGPPDGGRRQLLDISLAEEVARALRGTLLRALDGDAPETLSGHTPTGKPSRRSHLAFVPLADVGHPHATGSILGAALVPPRGMSTPDRDRLIEAVFLAEAAEAERTGGDQGDRRLRLTLGRRGELHLQRVREPSRLWTLAPWRWTRPAERWSTVSAIALGRNPGNLHSRDPGVAARATAEAEAAIATACEHIGLPRPATVWVHRRSLVTGAPAAKRFMPFPSIGKGPRRVCVHAEVAFDTPVRGPVLLGAGRFFGVGLCAPVFTDSRGGGS